MVEVGSWIGESAIIFSQYFKNVICVDPWGDQEGYSGDDIYQEFLKNTHRYKNIAHLRLTSREATDCFLDGSLDFVYIDGKHDYQSVKEDGTIWQPKLSEHGRIGGHDYKWKYHPGVCRAVCELFGKPTMVFKDNSWLI
jgi:hypothetical protein